MEASSRKRTPNDSLRISVVIPAYNYARFLPAAIDSALALEWPDVEVVVVNDGSTDDTPAVMESYGGRIIAVHRENGGHREACNTGFFRSTGDVVIFLDADDVLYPALGKELALAFRPGVSKIQFQMAIIDAEGEPTGAFLPQYRVLPTPERIHQWVRGAGGYPTPPCSGNAYARSFLEQIFPLEGSDAFSDGYCLAAAPYFGDIVTVPKPLVGYRVHGQNTGSMTTMQASRFQVEVRRARFRFEYAQRLARARGIDVSECLFNRSLYVLPYRLASLRLAPENHPISGDSSAEIVFDTARACFIPQGIPLEGRVALFLWTVLVATAPGRVSERLVLWRFASSSRPQVLRWFLGLAGVVKAQRHAVPGPS